MKGIINGKIICENEILENKVILFSDKIEKIIDTKELEKYEDIEKIDAKGNYVSPGFIDIHIHGSGGYDTMDGSVEAIKVISRTIAQKGTTAFLPTTMTMDKAKIYTAFDAIRKVMGVEILGAKVLGAHMEGPFINLKYKGAQNPNYILKPDYDVIKDYLDVIKIITIAPETDEDFKFIDKMRNRSKTVMSIGHSDATFEEAMDGIERGIKHATHTFNAMTPLHHRKPGIVGAVFASDITAEIIADKIHVHPGIYKTFIKTKGIDNVVLITDSMRAGCMEEGVYDLGGQSVNVKDGSARLEDGTLAGSILSLNIAVKNVFENTDSKLYEVIKMATLNPARVIGISDKKGSIEVNKDADFTIFDKKFEVEYTIVEGKIIYTK